MQLDLLFDSRFLLFHLLDLVGKLLPLIQKSMQGTQISGLVPVIRLIKLVDFLRITVTAIGCRGNLGHNMVRPEKFFLSLVPQAGRLPDRAHDVCRFEFRSALEILTVDFSPEFRYAVLALSVSLALVTLKQKTRVVKPFGFTTLVFFVGACATAPFPFPAIYTYAAERLCAGRCARWG